MDQNLVLGILGGTDLSGEKFKLWAQKAHILVAADSGADQCLAHGFHPDIIVGDFDSLAHSPDSYGAEIVKVDDQNLSDCDKLLAHVSALSDQIVLSGFEGDRFDHMLASLGSCLKSSLRIRIATRDGWADLLRPGSHVLRLIPGDRFSVLPILPCKGVSLKGARWPLNDVSLELGGQVSLSNIAEQESMSLELISGAVLVIRPLEEGRAPLWPLEDTV